jgi:hypothetical protein
MSTVGGCFSVADRPRLVIDDPELVASKRPFAACGKESAKSQNMNRFCDPFGTHARRNPRVGPPPSREATSAFETQKSPIGLSAWAAVYSDRTRKEFFCPQLSYPNRPNQGRSLSVYGIDISLTPEAPAPSWRCRPSRALRIGFSVSVHDRHRDPPRCCRETAHSPYASSKSR